MFGFVKMAYQNEIDAEFSYKIRMHFKYVLQQQNISSKIFQNLLGLANYI